MLVRDVSLRFGLATCLFALFAASALAVTDPALVLYLPFDENSGTTAKDASGKNNNATLKGAAKFGEGKYGSGLALTTNAHAEVAHNDMLNLQNLSLLCWVRLLKDTGDQQSGMEKGPAWGAGEYNLLPDYNNKVLLQIADLPAECADTCEAGDVMDGKWHHIAGTWDGTFRIYVDGKEVRNCPCKGALKTNTGPIFIGARNGAARWTEGFYDEIKVYSRALSAAEIATAMELTPTPVQPKDRATVLWGALKTFATR